MIKQPILAILLSCLMGIGSQLSLASDATVAVASNFGAAMRDIAAAFDRSTDKKVTLVFASSGKLFAQINNGAPFDCFFSADQHFPLLLENNNLAVTGSRFTYATGALALWSAKTNFIDQQGGVLNQGEFNKLALANPKLAPYGAAALDVLTKLNLVEATQGKWVQGENIAQTYQFVSSGNAELGFVALSQIKAGEGSYWLVPPHLYQPIHQDAVLLKRGENNSTAKLFLDFVRSKVAIEIIQRHGYTVSTNIIE